MIHNLPRIHVLHRQHLSPPLIWIVDRLAFDILQLRHPFPDVVPTRIKLLALQQGIEDPEIRLRIHTST